MGNRVGERLRRSLLGGIAILALTVAGTLAGTAAANAYVLSGCKWPGANIKYSNYTASLYYTASSQAAANWTTATDVNLSTGSGEPFSIWDNYNSSGAVGTTVRSCNIFGHYTSTAVYGNTFHMAALSANCKRLVYGHEIGHALGLNHASGNVMMYSSVSVCTVNGVYTVQPDDRNGVNSIY
ncbi:MAG: matrixin family metalloprotease [Microcella sp.]